MMTNIIDLLRPAQDIKYDNGTSTLTATNLNAAIDEVEGRLDTVETSATTLDTTVGNLVTLTGVATNAVNLGSFTGGVISDDVTIKVALQELETAHEALSGIDMEFANSALDYVVDNTAVPASEVLGDRYILSHDGGVPNAAYDGASAGDIVEFDGTNWVATTPTVGTFISADDESNVLYYYGGTWSTKAFENTTASTGLVKVGTDIRLADYSVDGTGIEISNGVIQLVINTGTFEIGPNPGVDGLKIKNGGIVTDLLNDTAVTAAKLGSDVAGTGLTGGDGAAINVDFGTGASQAIEGSNLASTAGAGLVGILDTANNYSASDVEGALVEINGSLAQKASLVSLASSSEGEGAGLIYAPNSFGGGSDTVEGVLTGLTNSPKWKSPLAASITVNSDPLEAINVSTTQAVTITLPATPTDGQQLMIRDVTGNASTFNITIARNGKSIDGVAADKVIVNDGAFALLSYSSTANNWHYHQWDAATIPFDNATSGLSAVNVQAAIDELQDNIDSVSSSVASWTVLTASATAVNGGMYAVDTTSAAVTITLPAAPSNGDSVRVFDAGRNVSVNAITVARNGNPIQGVADDVVNSSIEGADNTYVYMGETMGWSVTNG